MAGPWERYQPQEEGPWTRYAKPEAIPISAEERPFADAPMESSERLSRLAASYVPGSERIRAFVYATLPILIDQQFRDRPWSERYDRALRITRYRDDLAQSQGRGVADLAARTAGLGATAVGTGGYSLLRPVLSQTASLPQIARESARISGGIGAPAALANTRADTPAGQASDVAAGTVGSMALGYAAPYGFVTGSWLAGLPRRLFTGPGGANVPAQIATIREFEELGLPAPGVAVAESPTLQRTGRGLAGSWLGGPVQDDLVTSIDQLQRRIADTIRGRHGVQPPGEVGAQAQQFLRRNLLEETVPRANVEAMTPDELTALYFSRESYPTNFAAQYLRAERQHVPDFGIAAGIRGNFVDQFPPARARPAAPPQNLAVPSQRIGPPTATWGTLNELGRDARGAARQRPGVGCLLAAHARGARRRHCRPASGRARASRSANQANLTLPGLRDQRTMVGRAIGQAREEGDRGRIAALERVYQAMTRDLQRFLNEAGGTQAALMYSFADDRYRRFVNDIREPLRRIFGNNVSPDDAYRRLFAATQRGTQDTRLLNAYFQAIREKGDAQAAQQSVHALLAPMLEDGIGGFLRAWRNLSPEAVDIMHGPRGIGRLFTDLERYARLAERLAPYQQAMNRGGRGFDLSRPANLALAAGLVWHVPSALLTAGGVHLLARFMASPRYLRWLTTMPRYTRGGMNSREFRDHINRLHTIGGDDPELGHAVIEAVRGLVGVPGASAAEHRSVFDEEDAQVHSTPTLTGRENEPPLPAPQGPELREYRPNLADRVREGLKAVGANEQSADAAAAAVPFTPPGMAYDAGRLVAEGVSQGEPGLVVLGGLSLPTVPGHATVIGLVGASNLRAAGRPAAERAIHTARRMERQGVPIEDIRARTNRYIEQNDPALGGVVRLPDGQWGIEVSNLSAGFRPPPLPGAGHTRGRDVPLVSVLNDPELRPAYPQLAGVRVFSNPGDRWSYSWPGGAWGPGTAPRIQLGSSRPDVGTMLHEVDHQVQFIERFPYGANPDMFKPGGQLAHLRRPNESADAAYWRTAGEWLAWQTEQRRYMTGAERRREPIPMPDGLIVHYEDPR